MVGLLLGLDECGLVVRPYNPMHLFGKLQNEYEHLWKQVIRPPRSHYSEENLGPSHFCLESREVERRDFELTSIRNFRFQGSVWAPAEAKNYPCVLYLHGSGGNRTEG
jgi:cephalosporin-C deacetylase-like acetyl esterase